MKCKGHYVHTPSNANKALVLILGLKNSYRYLAVGMLQYHVSKAFNLNVVVSQLNLSETLDGHADNRI